MPSLSSPSLVVAFALAGILLAIPCVHAISLNPPFFDVSQLTGNAPQIPPLSAPSSIVNTNNIAPARALGFTCTAASFECPSNSMDAKQLLACSISGNGKLECAYGTTPIELIENTLTVPALSGLDGRIVCQYTTTDGLLENELENSQPFCASSAPYIPSFGPSAIIPPPPSPSKRSASFVNPPSPRFIKDAEYIAAPPPALPLSVPEPKAEVHIEERLYIRPNPTSPQDDLSVNDLSISNLRQDLAQNDIEGIENINQLATSILERPDREHDVDNKDEQDDDNAIRRSSSPLHGYGDSVLLGLESERRDTVNVTEAQNTTSVDSGNGNNTFRGTDF